jgi:hypothetical protein
MSSTSDAPDPTNPAHNDADEEATQDEEAAGEAQGGLVGAGADRSFTDTVDRRLARRAHEDPSPDSSAAACGERPLLEEDEDSPVRVDNPE